jgi:glycosyltransferase involved in cell wall biosynthesis
VNPAPLIQNLATEASGSLTQDRASRPWQVLHTCHAITEIADIVAGQLAVGMRPSVVSPEGFVLFADALRMKSDGEAVQISLLNAWNDVRHWRKVILDADPLSGFDLLHAHSFAAGMAGVRNYPATIYEVDRFIEDFATHPSRDTSNAADHSSWLSRSFRVAEQFVFSRAAAVAVRSESMRQAVTRRGASAENVFVVPAVLNEEEVTPPSPDSEWLQMLGISTSAVVVHAPKWKMEIDSDHMLTETARGLLQAFALALAEEETACLLVECDEAATQLVTECALHLQIASRVKFISAEDRQTALNAAAIVISDSYLSNAATPLASDIAREAMMRGKALLAADLPCNRDVTPNGRGCLWYRSGDYKDLGHRMAFLAHNSDFRASLAESGTRHLIESCNPAAVAMLYDAIYRHAAARRKSGGLQTPAIRLVPASAIL